MQPLPRLQSLCSHPSHQHLVAGLSQGLPPQSPALAHLSSAQETKRLSALEGQFHRWLPISLRVEIKSFILVSEASCFQAFFLTCRPQIPRHRSHPCPLPSHLQSRDSFFLSYRYEKLSAHGGVSLLPGCSASAAGWHAAVRLKAPYQGGLSCHALRNFRPSHYYPPSSPEVLPFSQHLTPEMLRELRCLCPGFGGEALSCWILTRRMPIHSRHLGTICWLAKLINETKIRQG